jgi:hypothetical protein
MNGIGQSGERSAWVLLDRYVDGRSRRDRVSQTQRLDRPLGRLLRLALDFQP